MTRPPASGRAQRTARPPTRRSPAVATGYPAPGGPWSRSAGSSLARGLLAGAARLAAPPPRWLPERLAAGRLAATGRPPPPPAPPPPPGWRPERRPRTGGTTAAWAPPPRHSPSLRPLSASMNTDLPASAALTEEPGAYRPHGSQPSPAWGGHLGWDHGPAGAPKASGTEGTETRAGVALGPQRCRIKPTTRTHPRPTSQVGRGGKGAHVRTDLGQDHLRGAAIHARDGQQQRHQGGERDQDPGHLDTEPLDRLIQLVDVGQHLPDQLHGGRA